MRTACFRRRTGPGVFKLSWQSGRPQGHGVDEVQAMTLTRDRLVNKPVVRLRRGTAVCVWGGHGEGDIADLVDWTSGRFAAQAV